MNNADWHHCQHSQVKFHMRRMVDLGTMFKEMDIFTCMSCGYRLIEWEVPSNSQRLDGYGRRVEPRAPAATGAEASEDDVAQAVFEAWHDNGQY